MERRKPGFGLGRVQLFREPRPTTPLLSIYRQKLLLVANDELGYRIPGNIRDVRIKILRHLLNMQRKPLR